jgi:Mycobacterium membrane protein
VSRPTRSFMFEQLTPGMKGGAVEERDVLARSDVAAGGQDVSQRSGRRPTLLRRSRKPSPAPQARDGSRKSHWGLATRVLRRLWVPLVILVVIGAGGLTVSRLHGIFGPEKRPSDADTKINDAKPFNPKHLTYEVFGPPGTVADISYFDVNGDPQRLHGARLPWSLKFAFTQAAVVGSIVAQGDSDSIGCRIVVDGVVKAEKISNEVNAFTFCLLKAA